MKSSIISWTAFLGISLICEICSAQQGPGSTVRARIANTILYVDGTDGNDSILIELGPSHFRPNIYSNGVKISVPDTNTAITQVFCYGYKGADTINASSCDVPSTIYGGQGDDLIYGTPYADYIDGNLGNDGVYGQAGNDKLFGSDGNDFIHGGQGDDQIDCGTGADTCYGDLGKDQLDLGNDMDPDTAYRDSSDVPPRNSNSQDRINSV